MAVATQCLKRPSGRPSAHSSHASIGANLPRRLRALQLRAVLLRADDLPEKKTIPV